MRTVTLHAVSTETEPAKTENTETTDASTGAPSRGIDLDDVAMMLRELRAASCELRASGDLRRAASR